MGIVQVLDKHRLSRVTHAMPDDTSEQASLDKEQKWQISKYLWYVLLLPEP